MSNTTVIYPPKNTRRFKKHCWCSGIMQDSHSCDPGSIPGQCKFFFVILQLDVEEIKEMCIERHFSINENPR